MKNKGRERLSDLFKVTEKIHGTSGIQFDMSMFLSSAVIM